jgi:phosphoesterase RecJ-like protein
MNEQLKVEALKIRAKLEAAEKILLSLHPSPDEDSVGSVLAMALWLRAQGKTVTVVSGDSKLNSWVRLVPGGETILEQSWQATDLNQFDLYLALDIASPKQITKLSEVVFPANLTVIVIDHHAQGEAFGQLRLVDGNYPATAEILYDLFAFWGVALTHDLAINLFLGIYGDTGGFQYSLTTRQTFLVAAELVTLAPDFAEYLTAVRGNNDPEAIDFQAFGLTLGESFGQGRVRLSPVPEAAWRERGIKPEHLQNNQVANILRSIAGCEVAASLIEIDGAVRISLRSRSGERYDVSKVAAALGGGGHKAAAATVIKKSLIEAKADLLKVVGDLYPDLLI